MMSLNEQKQADSIIRGDKDDFKRQSAELRQSRGIAGASTLGDNAFTHPQLSADPLAPRATVPLEPTVQAPRKIEHSSTTDMPFSSIPDSSITTTTTSSTRIESTPASGPAMMEKVGAQAGAGIEAAKQQLQPLIEPVVAKATSLYDQWKADDSSAAAPSGPSIQERATVIGSDLKERATVAGTDLKERATIAASQAQTVYREQVAPALVDAANKAGPVLSNAAAQAKPLLAQASAQAQVAAAQARPVIENAIEQAKPVIENAIEQAKPILANAAATASKIYTEQVQPALASGLTAAQEQLDVIREDGLSLTLEKAGTAYQRRVSSAKATVIETYEAKVPLEQRQQIARAEKAAENQIRYIWGRALNVWQTQAMPFIRERKLQAPLSIAGAVLVLLLGWTLLSALSASKASHEQVVVYQPNWRPSTGPVQGVEMPGLLDKANAKLSQLDNKIVDGIDTLKARSADLAQHAEDSIAMGIDSLKVKAAELNSNIPSTADIKARASSTLESAKAAMPSATPVKEPTVMDNIKTGAADLKARVNSAIHTHPIAEPSVIDNLKHGAADLKARVNSAIHPEPIAEPSVIDNLKHGAADLKARVNSAIHPAPVKEATVLDNIKDGVADLKARAAPTIENAKLRAENLKLRAEANINSARASVPSTAEIKARAESQINSARASIPSTADIKESASSTLESAKASTADIKTPSVAQELRLKINDRLEHVKALLPEQMAALRLRLGNLYERLTPAQRHFAHAHPEILDPENHAVSFVDAHGNAKSILDVDLE